jgi:membrane dipeptidase
MNFTLRGRTIGSMPVQALITLLLSVIIVNTSCRMVDKTKENTPQANQNSSTGPKQTADPLEIHKSAIAIDMHADTMQRVIDEGADISQRLDDGHLDAVRMREGGLDAQFFSIWVEPSLYGAGGKSAVDRADKQIAAVRALAEKHPETWELATTADDIRRIAGEGKLAALMGLEGGYAIDNKLENVGRYYNMGVRYMSGAWSVSTSWAGSSGDEVGQTRGLNDFGRQVIREMNRLGMMVDVSHLSDKAFWDIIETSTKPVVATHSNCRSIANVRRNLTDDMIRAIAKTGGVVCVVFYSEFVEPGWSEKKKKVDEEIAPLVAQANEAEKGSAGLKKIARDRVRTEEYARRLPQVPISHLVDHIDHIVKLVGIDFVGIGSDYDGIQATVRELSDVSQLRNLTAELLRRGYTAEDVKKILGGNMLRVMEQTEKN